jgi:hypothetical protein
MTSCYHHHEVRERMARRGAAALTDGSYSTPSGGHLFPKFARKIGMPRAYGNGTSMGARVID